MFLMCHFFARETNSFFFIPPSRGRRVSPSRELHSFPLHCLDEFLYSVPSSSLCPARSAPGTLPVPRLFLLWLHDRCGTVFLLLPLHMRDRFQGSLFPQIPPNTRQSITCLLFPFPLHVEAASTVLEISTHSLRSVAEKLSFFPLPILTFSCN